MIKHKPSGKVCLSRLDMKRYLGGEVEFNKAMKNREFEFINLIIYPNEN